MEYTDFLDSKRKSARPVGFDPGDIISRLRGDQVAVCRWALRRGRAAIFGDTGTGKTAIQLEWAHRVSQENDSAPVLILAPLAVAKQTAREGEKFAIAVTVCESQDDVRPGINVTNYEKLHKFDATAFCGIVLDESSILKAFDGKTRKMLSDFAEGIHYRLACTATPAPNDLIEIINHAEFLGVMSGKEIIALYFTQDGNTTHKWRLKGHAQADFWRWVASWAVAYRRPSDLGFPDDGFNLPELRIKQITVDGEKPGDALFDIGGKTLQERRRVRKASMGSRVDEAAALANMSTAQWLIWCDFNDESAALAKAIPNAVEVKGSDSAEHKTDAMIGFAEGRYRVLVSKPSICGFGMNWQNCNNMIFVGMSDSYEQQYQAIRRCWRYGQKKPVNVFQIVSEADGDVVANIRRKEQEHKTMMDTLIQQMQLAGQGASERDEMEYTTDAVESEGWRLMLGDSSERIKEIPDESIGLSVFSPPFPGMYAYSNGPRDIGNCEDIDQMIDHFRFMVPDLLRITMPGRSACVHLTQLTAMKSRDGYIGLKDYRGAAIQMFIDAGWVYAGEVCIDKNPQIQATRNKERGLLFKSLATDSSVMRMALADYVLIFRKPGENAAPIRAGISSKYSNEKGWITEDEWVEWAAPVWYRHVSAGGRFAASQPDYPALFSEAKQYRRTLEGESVLNGVMETDVLNVAQARDTNDERHLCPLQLGVIERCIKLWSAPGDTVFSPFAGIGSEGFEAVRLNRKFIGCELKRSYWMSAIRNLRQAESLARAEQGSLLAMMEVA